MFLETMDPKTGEKVELKLALSMEQLAELQARAAKASTGTEYIGRLQFFGPLRVGDSGLSTNIYKPQTETDQLKQPRIERVKPFYFSEPVQRLLPVFSNHFPISLDEHLIGALPPRFPQ